MFVNRTLAISEVTQTENISLNVSGDTRDSIKYNGPGKLNNSRNKKISCMLEKLLFINNFPKRPKTFIINQDIDIFMVFVAVQHAVIFVTVSSEKIPTQYWSFDSDEP